MEYSKDCPFCMNTRFKNNKLVNLPSEELFYLRIIIFMFK